MIPIIDSGHGGMIAGVYQTKGKQFTFKDGTTIFEGEFNRAIKARLLELLQEASIPYYDLVPEQKDISLSRRVWRANQFHRQHGRKTFLVSIHADAGGGSGSGAFLAPKSSQHSQQLAKTARHLFYRHFPESKHRGTKIRNFFILRYTSMPAILLENFFMDNEEECKTYLLTKEGRDRIATYIFDVIQYFIQNA